MGIQLGEAGEDGPCQCGMIYCDHMCKSGKREFLESPHAAKRALEEVKKIYADKRGPNNCRGCKCQCCNVILLEHWKPVGWQMEMLLTCGMPSKNGVNLS